MWPEVAHSPWRRRCSFVFVSGLKWSQEGVREGEIPRTDETQGKYGALSQCWLNFGTPSQTVAQNQAGIGSTHHGWLQISRTRQEHGFVGGHIDQIGAIAILYNAKLYHAFFALIVTFSYLQIEKLHVNLRLLHVVISFNEVQGPV